MNSRFRALSLSLASVVLMMAGCDKTPQADGSGSGSSSAAAPATQSSGKKTIVVGYSQIGAESAWRTANTESIKSEAAKRGVDLRFSDAQQKQENQIKALRSFVNQ